MQEVQSGLLLTVTNYDGAALLGAATVRRRCELFLQSLHRPAPSVDAIKAKRKDRRILRIGQLAGEQRKGMPKRRRCRVMLVVDVWGFQNDCQNLPPGRRQRSANAKHSGDKTPNRRSGHNPRAT